MSLESLSYRGTETLDKIEGTERGILLGSSISLDFKNTRVAIGHLGNVISQGKVTVSSLIDADSNTWQTSKIITEPSASNGSYFGHAVSMNWKGTRIAVGAYGVDKVYVFDATSTSSNPWATYVSNTISGYTDSNFGYSVSLGQDIDTTLAIGAPNHNRVDVWKLSNSSWSLAYSNIGDDIPNVIPLNSTSGTVTINSKLSSNVSSLQYGFSCKLAPFSTHLIVGAPGTPLDAISSANSDYSGSNTSFLEPFIPHAQRQSGSTRVLVTTDDWVSNVSQLGQTLSGLEYDGSNYITNSGNLFFPTLGYSVAINFDGSVIAVSAPNRQGGTVRVYEYSSVSSSWEQRGVDITSGSALMTGFSIGLDYTGNRIAMSMISNWAFPAVLNALLYVLDWSGSDWIEAQVPISSKYPGYDYNSNEGTKMLSGYRLDITDGNQVAVSRIWWDDNDFQGDDYYTGSGGSVPLSTAVTTFPANQNAYGRVEFYFFLITATFTGNSIFEGYVTVRELRIGPNDDATDNTIPKRISFGGTTGDNYYDETLIENRVITGSAAELLLHKNHQTNETIDRVRIKASEIHLDHMRMYHSVYQGGQESKDIQTPRFILNQFGAIAIGNLYSGNDSTDSTTSLAETYLDIKAETQIRDKLNVNYKNRSKLLKIRDNTYDNSYFPTAINTRCEDLISSSKIIDEQPGAVVEITISNGSGCPYSSTEKAFEFTGTTSGIGQSNESGNWNGSSSSMYFWLKLKSSHSSYSGNVLCSWGETLSTVSGVYRGGCLQLTSTGFTLNLGSGIGTRTYATTLDTNKWHHICVRFPTETTNMSLNELYINGSSVSLSGTLTNSSSTPNWDSQGWHFGYGDASGSISGPAGTFMGNMFFNAEWQYGGYNFMTYSYNDGPPTECLSVGGDAIIENKLGIGTVTPAYELDVVGDINFTGNIYQNSNLFSGGSSLWTQSSSDIYYTSGNVGIGTTNPVEKLHVYRNTSGESNMHIQAYSDTTGNRAALYLGTPHSNDPNAQPKCAIIADAVSSYSRADLHFCVETTANNGTPYRASTSNSRMMIDGLTGYVGIGTSNPQRTLDVNGDSRFDAGVFLNWSAPTLYLQDTDHRSCMLHCNSNQFYVLNGTGTNSVNWATVNGNWALQIDLTNNQFNIGGSVYVNGSLVHSSDIRIKKDIVDIDDTSALEKLRLIKPKTYKYRNEEERGSDIVYGFIAQDVSNVLPYAVKTDANPVPTILSSSNVTALTDTSVQLTLDKTIPDDINLTNTSNIFITVDGVGGYACPVISTTGNNIITIERTSELSNITSTSNAYIFGEYVQDFHTLDKNAIFTIATAALQEVDRQLQAEKTKVATLETQVADLLARVTALENN